MKVTKIRTRKKDKKPCKDFICMYNYAACFIKIYNISQNKCRILKTGGVKYSQLNKPSFYIFKKIDFFVHFEVNTPIRTENVFLEWASLASGIGKCKETIPVLVERCHLLAFVRKLLHNDNFARRGIIAVSNFYDI